MPGYKTHLAGGVVVALGAGALAWTTGLLTDWRTAAVLAAACVAGSLFPDVDTDSKAQRLFYLILLGLDAWLLATGRTAAAAWLGLGAILPGLLPHRGLTHTLAGTLLLSAAVALAPRLLLDLSWARSWPLGAAFGAGLLTHLLLDRR